MTHKDRRLRYPHHPLEVDIIRTIDIEKPDPTITDDPHRELPLTKRPIVICPRPESARMACIYARHHDGQFYPRHHAFYCYHQGGSQICVQLQKGEHDDKLQKT